MATAPEPTDLNLLRRRERRRKWKDTDDMPGFMRMNYSDLMSRPGNLTALVAPDDSYHLFVGRGEPLAMIFSRRNRTPIDVLSTDQARTVFLAIERGGVPLYLNLRVSIAEQRKVRMAWAQALLEHERSKGLDRWRPLGWRAFVLSDI